ncbi:UPF0193 protein EVG1 homolog isoform X1 [Pieris brassicae]|uniref:Uncharacterized protein n=1 Tax=Pieris brassicae TaxID=7116 RepID=A0A9P0X530_PIEBR|nr:UPF0193 protein EVG1 homolog isoform X1 [Pieris brassicae]CAH3998122.1 unnamed protein product [Pieris brassicae]
METPDADGFVNVFWPSKSVPHGGIFHTRVVEPSRTQETFLKVLLEESRLSIAQRKKSELGLRQYEKKEDHQSQVDIPMVRPRTSRRRSLSAIRESGILDAVDYRPIKRGEDREKLKDCLAKVMAYGEQEQKPLPAPHRAKSPPKLPTKKEKWHDLMTQIRERAEWLAEMEDMGHGAPHRELIQDQIAERLRALDALGLDEPASARSKGSGFSVLPSVRSKDSGRKETARESTGSMHSSVRSKQSTKSVAKKRSNKEENVLCYQKLPTLQYSPRRRV